MSPTKNFRAHSPAVLALAYAIASAANAAVVQYDSGSLFQTIPDDSATGLASTITISEAGLVTGVTVSFEVSVPAGDTGWAGDLYAYLRHDDGFAVLLNRPGRTAENPFGYADSRTIRVTFSDDASNGDINNYRTTLGGSDSVPLTGALLGNWAPDGRAIDPDAVTHGTPRTAMLGGFAGHDLTGNWTLFVADLSSGGMHRLDGWSLALEVQPIPEPGTMAAAVCSGLFIFAAARRWKR